MWSTAREIAAGDLVIVWMSRDQLQPVIIEPGKDINNRYGHYRHSDLIGIPFGSKVGSRTGRGFIYLLRPTPELWTMALPHRTQILYLADIAFITSHLDIRQGSRVIEAAANLATIFTSSKVQGRDPSLTRSYAQLERLAISGLMNFMKPGLPRLEREEFARHGFSETVTLTHRNVCKDGFTVTDTADALFLDIPAPWEAVEHAKRALRKDRTTRICCFSPCMEQVLRTVSALNDVGFTDITMYETLLRPHDVTQIPALQPISQISEKLKKAEQKREDKRLKQIALGRNRTADDHRPKRKREGAEAEEEIVAADLALDAKRAKTEGEEQRMEIDESSAISTFTLPDPTDATRDTSDSTAAKIVSKANPEVRGHTSYLTFARLVPKHPSLAHETIDKATVDDTPMVSEPVQTD